jgi:hypothetical protein
MADTIGSSCSRECNYQVHECEVDGMPGSECRAHYNALLSISELRWLDAAVSDKI